MILLAVSCNVGPRADAAIVATGGAVVVIDTPPVVRTNLFEDDTQIRAFAEQQDVALPEPLAVEIVLPGTSPSATSKNLSPGTIPAGTVVRSYLTHFDAVGNRSADPLRLTGSITFDADVIGLIISGAAQNATDAFPGAPATSYPQREPGRGLELLFGAVTDDFVTLSADRRTVTLDLHSGSVQDQVRIITAVPEPTTLGAAAFACLCASSTNRRCARPAARRAAPLRGGPSPTPVRK